MELGYSPARHLLLTWDFKSHAGSGRRDFTLDEECNIDTPYTDCCRHDDLISIPNSNAGNLNERLIWKDCSNAKVLVKTYTRRTIKREAAEVEMKESTWKKRQGHSVKPFTLSEENAIRRSIRAHHDERECDLET